MNTELKTGQELRARSRFSHFAPPPLHAVRCFCATSLRRRASHLSEMSITLWRLFY